MSERDRGGRQRREGGVRVGKRRTDGVRGEREGKRVGGEREREGEGERER